MLLEDLCTGKLHSQNVVIEDVSEAPGRPLILVLLHGMCQRYDQVLLMAFERSPHFYLNALPASLREKIKIPDLPRPKNIGDRLSVGPLIAAAQSAICGEGTSVGVVIDSVSSIIFTHASPTVLPQLVRSLLDYRERDSKVEQVLSLVHSDVHDESTRHIVCGHPDTLIRLQPASSPRHHYSCLIRHGDAWQRPAFHTEEFNISTDFLHIQDVVRQSKTDAVHSVAQPQQADPTANLTFNLSLKPEERAAKDQVVLPYTQISSSENQSGVIHYIPDADDDFDDEDPDEDLDF